MKKSMRLILAGAGATLLTTQAFAQTANSAQITSFMSSSISWLSTVLGPFVFILGIIIVGCSLAVGNEDAVRKGAFVVGGGALIFLSQSVVALLKSMAGM